MTEKISYSRYLEILRDLSVDETEIGEYSILVQGDGGLDWRLRPNPDLVDMTDAEVESESGMAIGNGLARWRRKQAFRARRRAGEKLPILVSEGDSWFQFPVFIREVIDNLENDYLIWSVGAAGDTAQNMVLNDIGRGKTEYMQALGRFRGEVQGFLFSAAGNDVIGEDPETNRPVLQDLLVDFQSGITDPALLINRPALERVLNDLVHAYETVIGNIRADAGFADLPVFIHAYDYAFPHPWGGNDQRNPMWAAKDQWLGRPLDARGIVDPALRRGVIKVLINRLYDRFQAFANAHPGVHLVDCRNALPEVTDWADEIHGTSEGYAKVAERFRSVINAVVPPIPVG